MQNWKESSKYTKSPLQKSQMKTAQAGFLAGLAKVEYLANVIGETARKQAGQKPEFAILNHEIRINLDIIDDYIQESIRIINELREALQNE